MLERGPWPLHFAACQQGSDFLGLLHLPAVAWCEKVSAATGTQPMLRSDGGHTGVLVLSCPGVPVFSADLVGSSRILRFSYRFAAWWSFSAGVHIGASDIDGGV